MILGRTVKTGLAVTAASLGLSCVLAAPASAQSIQQQVINNVIENILQDVRDQLQGRRVLPSGRALRFSSEGANDFDANAPFAESNPNDPFNALAYTKTGPVYTKAPVAVAPTYLYGINLVGSGDQSRAAGITTSSASATGAFDVTKIGIFTASDALTFVATGSGVWSHAIGIDTDTGSGAGTLAYTNGGFSTDFTANASWTHESLAAVGIVAPPNSTSLSYTGNVQYKFDLPTTWFFEPTIGFTYTDLYTANFGTQIGDSTEVHGGARVGFDAVWYSVRVQPSITMAAFSIVGQSGAGAAATPGLPAGVGVAAGATPTGALGGRGSAKINFLWTDHFSSFIEAHASAIASTNAAGASGGLRWTF
jgi:hypothetical protein